jgi:hypothetical protein
MTFEDLIERCGGAHRIIGDLVLTSNAIRNWKEKGLPERHFPYFMDRGNATIEELWALQDSIKNWTRRYREWKRGSRCR